MIELNLFLAIAPAIGFVIYFYRKDRFKPEPKKTILRAFLVGILSTIPAIFAGVFISDLLLNQFSFYVDIFIKAFVVAGFIEETSKLLIIMIFLYNHPDFDEVTDGIIYAITVSLGFACLENIFYSINDPYVAIMRSVTAVPGHAIWSGLMGYYIGLAKFDHKNKDSLIFVGLIIAIFFHGLYNFVLFTESYLSYLIIPILIVGYQILNKNIQTALEMDVKLKNVDPFPS